MVRPKASNEKLCMAAAFAAAVTTETIKHEDLIARTGSFSIFALFSNLAPEVF